MRVASPLAIVEELMANASPVIRDGFERRRWATSETSIERRAFAAPQALACFPLFMRSKSIRVPWHDAVHETRGAGHKGAKHPGGGSQEVEQRNSGQEA